MSALEYRLDYALTSSLEGGLSVTASPDATSEDRVSVTLHGLLPGTRYYYQVTAITAVGSEPSGLQSFITTDEVTGEAQGVGPEREPHYVAMRFVPLFW